MYASALFGGIAINASIAITALVQEMYSEPKCVKARYAVFGAMILAIFCSTLIIFLEWLPIVGEIAASITAALCLLGIAGALSYAVYYTGRRDCTNARLYSISLIISLIICSIIVAIMTIFA